MKISIFLMTLLTLSACSIQNDGITTPSSDILKKKNGGITEVYEERAEDSENIASEENNNQQTAETKLNDILLANLIGPQSELKAQTQVASIQVVADDLADKPENLTLHIKPTQGTDYDKFELQGSSLILLTDLTETFDFSLNIEAKLPGHQFEKILKFKILVQTSTLDTPSPEAPADLILATENVLENNQLNDVVGYFTIDDYENYDHVISFIDSQNFPDNSSFQIVGQELVAATVFDYESKNEYTIKVELRNADFPEKKIDREFIVSISDLNEPKTFSTGNRDDLGDNTNEYLLPPGKNPINIVGMGAGVRDRIYYMWFDDYTYILSTSRTFDEYGGPNTYSLPPGKSPQNIVGIARGDRFTMVYFDDKTYVRSLNESLEEYSDPIEYFLPPGKEPSNIVGVVEEADDEGNARINCMWFDDLTYISSFDTDFARFGDPSPYTLPPGKEPKNVVGMTYGTSFFRAWYNN